MRKGERSGRGVNGPRAAPPPEPDPWRVRVAVGVEALERALNDGAALGYLCDEVRDLEPGAYGNEPRWLVFMALPAAYGDGEAEDEGEETTV